MKTILLLAGLGLASLAIAGCSYEDYHRARYGDGWARVSDDPYYPNTYRSYPDRRYYHGYEVRPAGVQREPGYRSY